MSTLGVEFAQSFLLGREWRSWLWRHRCSKRREHTGIDLVGFAQDASGTRILADAIGLDPALPVRSGRAWPYHIPT